MENLPVFEARADEITAAFEIESRRKPATEAELLEVLSRQIEAMFEQRPEFLFSLLYRNDILESKIVAALHPEAPEPGHIGLARAVLERQKERIESKKTFAAAADESLKDFQW